MKVLLVHPGASWSTADVEAGLRYGLEHHGVEIVRYRLDARIARAHRYLHGLWRSAKRTDPAAEKPQPPDVFYQAGVGAIERALRHDVEIVLVVSAMYLHPDVVVLMKRAGLRVVVLFTESPYDLEHELKVAALADGCWTIERSVVEDFKRVNPNSAYLPHAWHPAIHRPQKDVDADVPAHDVVFVGTGFPERIELFRAIDWTGIDLGLYGGWHALGSRNRLRQYVKGSIVSNDYASQLYRRATIGLNLYRLTKGFGKGAPRIEHAESLSPRAYELAACGVFHLSEYRDEVPDVFGDLVPTFRSPQEAEALIRRWLRDDVGRALMARRLPSCVAGASWIERAGEVVRDLKLLYRQEKAS